MDSYVTLVVQINIPSFKNKKAKATFRMRSRSRNSLKNLPMKKEHT